ncbi:MAG: DoxX family protein, partial [Beijerinckiaceae bacterium]|nr:DoxX family protein [Beijerinckiaceae bacterium]
MSDNAASAPKSGGFAGLIHWAVSLCEKVPYWLIALTGRIGVAGVFWKSGQTKIEGFGVNLATGETQFGLPKLSDSAVMLFREEYKMPMPEVLAPLAAFAEHFFPFLILIGLATRFSAIALLVMTLVIQIFVYPTSYPEHSVWAAIFLMLIAYGPG